MNENELNRIVNDRHRRKMEEIVSNTPSDAERIAEEERRKQEKNVIPIILGMAPTVLKRLEELGAPDALLLHIARKVTVGRFFRKEVTEYPETAAWLFHVTSHTNDDYYTEFTGYFLVSDGKVYVAYSGHKPDFENVIARGRPKDYCDIPEVLDAFKAFAAKYQ